MVSLTSAALVVSKQVDDVMFLADYHTHSAFSHDGHDGFPAMLAVAERTGLCDLCVTDHCDIGLSRPFLARERYEAYLAARNGSHVKLLLGVELGEAIHNIARAEEAIAAVPYDFIIGSLHELRGEQDFYHLRCDSAEEYHRLLKRYFAELLELAEWGRFDVLAHLNYPLRYTPWCAGFLPRYEEEIRGLFKILRDTGKGIELNMSGGPPFGDILALWRECGGEIVPVGSDAHRAADVGKNIAAGLELLRGAGFRYVAAFEQRMVRYEKI